MGEGLISAEEAQSNAWWRKGLLAGSANWVLLGLPGLVAAVFELAPLVPPGAPMETRVMFGLGGLLVSTVLPVAFSGWWASMRTASSLCRDEEIKVIHAIDTTEDPGGDEWYTAVAERALGLIPKLRVLSEGWSDGLIGFGGFFWLFALGYFTLAINVEWCAGMDATNSSPPGTQRNVALVATAIYIMLPLLLALDVAATSTYCDLLVERLNDMRAKHGPESDDKITWLETTLKQLVSPTARSVTHRSVFALRLAKDSIRPNAVRTKAKVWASRWAKPLSTRNT